MQARGEGFTCSNEVGEICKGLHQVLRTSASNCVLCTCQIQKMIQFSLKKYEVGQLNMSRREHKMKAGGHHCDK